MSDLGVYVEIDLPFCALTFSEAPCTAAGIPCFNTRNNSHDCGDPANYSATTQTVRFALNNGIEFWPLDDVPTHLILKSAKSTSATINPAVDMGTRAQCTLNLGNELSTMAGLDKNLIARDAGEFERGTFLGKFKARNPYIFGSEVRVYRGYAGGQFEVEYYTVGNFSGPDNMGGMTIKCVDFLKLTNGDSSQFPAVTVGNLVADIDTVVTTFDVEPIGIGDLQYPVSGHVAVGKEAMSFTRVGDTFTVVRDVRGELQEHKDGDNVQLVGEYSGQTSAAIINDLIVNYTPLDAGYIDFAEWEVEVNDFQSALYSAFIVKPEPVSKLINELVEQSGLIFYADVKTRKIILKVLRPVVSLGFFDEDKIQGFRQSERQDDRVSQAWTYYNQKNPFLKLDDPFNYYSVLVSPTAENLYATEVIKKTFSRWIPDFAQSVALNLNSRILQRYINPPRDFKFGLFRDETIKLGQGAQISHRANEDAFGAPRQSPVYITSLSYGDSMNAITAQEFIFSDYSGPGGGGNILIPIDSDEILNDGSVSLRSIYDNIYASLVGVVSVDFIIKSSAFVGARFNTVAALSIGDFGPIVPTLTIDAGGYIVGAAGNASSDPLVAAGGLALNADYPVAIENNGVIGGGGGAGGIGDTSLRVNPTAALSGNVGPCGAGYKEGSANGRLSFPVGLNVLGDRVTGTTKDQMIAAIESFQGTVEYSFSGNGGDLGQDGTAGGAGAGGLAGAAITNNSNITWLNMGDIRGAIS
jgi:hypothetical protein